MKHLKTVLFMTILVLTIGLIGCQTKPMYTVDQSPIDVSAKATLSDIKKTIMRSGAQLGWQMKENEPGVITGILNIRKHMAKVKIPYSKTSYSILYEDSSNLNYDGSSIHRQYNNWVMNLDRTIQANLSIL